MVVSGFEWDDDNILHIERHEFTPEEVEEVFTGDHKVRRTRQKRYIALGETLEGRLPFVVFRRLPGGLVSVITSPEDGRKGTAAVSPQVGGANEEETISCKGATPEVSI